MKKIIISLVVIGLLSTSSLVSINALEIDCDISEKLEIAVNTNAESFDGYILYNPMYSPITYLLNTSNKAIVHRWFSSHMGLTVYLLESRNLLRTCQPFPLQFNSDFSTNGQTGHIEMLNCNGICIWNFEYSNSQYCLHHDIAPLPNGNILMVAWEKKTQDEAIAAGHKPDEFLSYGMFPDYIIEVEPTGSSGGNIVWEWHVWDHLIQDYDSSKANYGVVADHPELIDINLVGFNPADWLHTNSIDYNEELDQILISSPGLNEILIIDHSTTTEEAAGHTGGNSGKGGDIIYRWGNPLNYRRGDGNDCKLRMQHDARWIEPGCPGEGHITIFNNQGANGRSCVDEIVPPVDENGNYYLEPDSVYGPEEPIWQISSGDRYDFDSQLFSGAQRLPNGNTLICSGLFGKFFVATPDKDVVWEEKASATDIFNMFYYPPDYPGISATTSSTPSSQSSTQPSSQPISKITTQTTIGSTTLLGKTTSK